MCSLRAIEGPTLKILKRISNYITALRNNRDSCDNHDPGDDDNGPDDDDNGPGDDNSGPYNHDNGPDDPQEMHTRIPSDQ